MNLVLFTSSYPYVRGGEQNFLDNEIRHLVKYFEHVVLVPERKQIKERFGNQSGAEVDDSYAELLNSQAVVIIFLRGLFSSLFIKGIMDKKFPRFSLKALRRLIAIAGKAEITRQWVESWASRQGIDYKDFLFYTYWFDQATLGVGLLKEKYPNICLISRAHNYDIYEERYYDPPFWPCRRYILNILNQLFPCSLDGADYMRLRYPEYANRYTVSLLGVEEPGFITRASEDGTLRIVSCSLLRPEKRVALLLEGFLRAAIRQPNRRMEWHHIGNGEDRDLLQIKANDSLPLSAKVFFVDYTDNFTLMKFYRDNPVDVFVNVSSSEGIPVSIMEAISCGIPIIATPVGGSVEIVSDKNGILLSENPTPDEIAVTLLQLFEKREQMLDKRLGSRAVWLERYNEAINYEIFAQQLIKIRNH